MGEAKHTANESHMGVES